MTCTKQEQTISFLWCDRLICDFSYRGPCGEIVGASHIGYRIPNQLITPAGVPDVVTPGECRASRSD